MAVILRKNHRQGEDRDFSEILNKIRVGEQDQNDFDVLRNRVYKRNDDRIPDDSIHIFATNAEVNAMNQAFLERLPGEEIAVETTPTRSVTRAVIKAYSRNISSCLSSSILILERATSNCGVSEHDSLSCCSSSVF